MSIRADVATLRVLLLTLFFGSAGMVADPLWIGSHAHWVAGAALAVTAGKFLIITAIFLAFGQSFRVAAATGLTLAQIGEFAFVLGTIGRSSGVVSDDLYALIVSVTIVSFVLSALVVPMAPRWGEALARFVRSGNRTDEAAGAVTHADVVVIGFGPAGQLGVAPLLNADLNVTVIDLNRKGVRLASEYGFCGQVGDATSAEVLEHASIGEADLVVITLPDFRSTLLIIELVRSLNPSAVILARSRYHIHRYALIAAGAEVFGDEEQVGGAIGEHVTAWLDEKRGAAAG